MSSNISGNTVVMAVPRPTKADLIDTALRSLLGDPGEWVCSVQLFSLADRVPTVTTETTGLTTEHTIATTRRDAIRSSKLTEALLRAHAPEGLTQADHLLEVAATAKDLGLREKLAKSADDLLRMALSGTADRLSIDERHLVSSAADRALTRLGYTVDASQGKRTTGLWAARGDTILAVLIQDGGRLETDIAGLAGGSCEDVSGEFIEALAAEGVEFQPARSTVHGDNRGGQLISRAVAAKSSSKAMGLVAQFERGVVQETRRNDKLVSAPARVKQAG